MQVILLGVVVFVAVVLSLVFVLLAAKAKLVNTEAVTLGINGDADRAMQIPAGSTLLNTLTDAGIFLPSACGGKGSCGVCTCKVISGGGGVLPTELGHLSRGEAAEGVRLACQVKVRQDIDSSDPFVPVIICTANTEYHHVCTARDNGMTEYLAKPVSAQTIYGRICALVENHRPFIRVSDFFGPDRRRHHKEEPGMVDRRKRAI